MGPIEHFHFCPKCGVPAADRPAREHPVFHCAQCNFVYYFNPAIAAAGIVLRPDHQALFIRRAKEPAQGKLAFPGGFVDIGETAEEGLRREVREEVGLELETMAFLCSAPNTYPYRDVTYPVLDLFFVARAASGASATALDGVSSFCWLDPLELDPVELAFSSLQQALRTFQQSRRESSS